MKLKSKLKSKITIWLVLAVAVASLALLTGIPSLQTAPGPAATVADDAYPPIKSPPYGG